MWMRVLCWGAWLLLPLAHAALPPANWVPMRWPAPDPASLELLASTPVNCLLLDRYPRDFVRAAAERGLVTLAVVRNASELSAAAERAAAAKVDGLVLEGDFPAGAAARVKPTFNGVVIELVARNRMRLGTDAPVLGTWQALWPGVQVQTDGAVKAGPSGAAWVDTNTGFIRAVRAWGDTPLWIANRPPEKTVVTVQRYLQAVADAAASGARWVVALDSDFSARLLARDAEAVAGWKRIAQLLAYFEQHPEWRALQPAGKLAIVQDPAKGGLLSGGIIDMIAARQTPVRPVPRQRLTPGSLAGISMAVNIDADSLDDQQRAVLKDFTRSGGTLLTGPPGWHDEGAHGDAITLEKKDLDRLNDIFHDVNSMVGRRNLGVRLFNVSSMLSNLLTSRDGSQVVVHLVNYSGFAVENVAMHFLGTFSHATLLTPDGPPRVLELYKTDEGLGVDIEKVGICATVKLE